MKSLVFFTLLLLQSKTTEVSTSNQCTCEKLLSLADCKQKLGCSWSSTNNQCSESYETEQEVGYCPQAQNATMCAKLKGCAYIEPSCVIFAGCSAYKGGTDYECQQISKYCNSDGTAYCVDPGTCSSYKNENTCNDKASKSGSGTCVWDANECRDQKCTEANAQFSTDEQCSNFIKGCVTNGKGCVSSLGTCFSYDGDADRCNGLIGTDGYCQGTRDGTKCSAKICTEAESSYISDNACTLYQIGCVTTGYGCVKRPLGACSTLTGNDIICAFKTGSDGKCKGVVDGKVCSVVSCTDAPIDVITDQDCDAYKKGCVTTGRGCINIRPDCSAYRGTNVTCDSYIGKDGKCKGNSDLEGACSLKLCAGADATLNTDEQCNNYQYGCKTTGKGCIAKLSTCSSYTGDSTTCDGYIGTDGKCKGGTSSGPCAPKLCNEAPFLLVTNEDCANYLIGCIASGTGGCITAGACSTLILSTQCDGKPTCQWTPQCVKNVVCADLTSEILCKTVTLQNGNTCWWSFGSCISRVCTQAPATYNTDSLCDSFLKGCLTKKIGCLAPSESCTNYQGTKLTCQTFTVGCTNTEQATDTSICIQKECSQNTTSITDSECEAFHKGCLTNGAGCVTAITPCSLYSGTSTEICSKFTGNSKPCWWVSGDKCVDKQCSQADATFTTDIQCKSFLADCLTNGSGCRPSSDDCTRYTGNQIVCGNLSKGCARVEACKAEPICSEITGATSQYSCDQILPGVCMFIKDKCVNIGSCSSYTHTQTLSLEDCQKLKNASGVLCYWVSGTSCLDRACSQIVGSAGTITLATCRAHLSDCAANSNGTACETFDCTHSINKTQESDCQDYHPKCHYHTGACKSGNDCSNFTMTAPQDCANVVTGNGGKCASGTGVCADSTCASATIEDDCRIRKVKYSSDVQYASSVSQFCMYNSAASPKCEQKLYSKAAIHLKTNITSPTQCIDYFETCVMSYSAQDTSICTEGVTGTIPSAMGCVILKGTDYTCSKLQGRYRDSVTGTYSYKFCMKNSSTFGFCEERTCAQITDGKTDAICQAYLPTCKTNGVSCVDQSTACTTFSSTAEGCANIQGVTSGSKCQQTPSNSPAACIDRACYHNGTATTDIDCKKYKDGCITTGKGCVVGTTKCSGQYGNQDGCKALTGNGKKCWSTSTTTKGPCIDRICSHNTTATTDIDCDTFLTGCVTKGTGCIESTAECSSYQGTQTDCEKFSGNGKSCTNDTIATATTACKTKDCTKLTADSYSEAVCQAFGKQCHYNGTKCDVKQSCPSMKGNFITCATYVATDGPCKGTALQTEIPTSCSTATCANAPITFTTDDECKQYKAGCVTNGRGCASSVNCGDVQNESSCLAVKSGDNNICIWASQCRDVQSACSSFTSSGSSVCLTSKVTSGFGICVWKNSTCTESTCEDLPLTVGSEDDCTGFSTTCTFGGANQGCVTKGYCTSYKTIENCTNAKSKDKIGACTWDETITSGTNIVGCRAKDCKDAATYITTDSNCDSFLAGCKTTGAGCFQPPSSCPDFKTKAHCIQDSALQPCLWYNSRCIQYFKCEDLKEKTIAKCQQASKFCTTDYAKCIPLQLCTNYLQQNQCVIGTDGSCGWVTSTKKCQLFTQCKDLISKVNSECQAFNPKCISNGTNCIEIGECASYAESEIACKLGGTDGICFFDKNSTSCRLRQCSDNRVSTTSHSGCFAYQINNIIKCTSDGYSCIPLTDCSYYNQNGCVLDSNFNQCIFDNVTQSCKKKTCIDIKKTKSSDCSISLAGCISNGTTCIPRANCSTYTTKESCNAGGLDGSCAFMPSSQTSNIGVCKLFSQCSDANSDQIACQSKSSSCKWTSAFGTKSSTCSIHSCDSAVKGTTNCLPVPNLEESQYTVCVVSGSKCISGDPSQLDQNNCYKMSQYTYSWNATKKKCLPCNLTANNSTTMNNTLANRTNISQTKLSLVISIIFIIQLFIQ